MNRAEEDYIKTIYELTTQRKKELVKTNEIADAFGFTDQTINEMIKKLVAKRLVKFMPYKGVYLTKNGQREAIRLIRSHRIWEVFLTQKLGYQWQEVHEDAERLEHVSSVTLIDKLDAILGYPKYCQHGNPIPSKDGDIEPFSLTSLDHVKEGEIFKITRVLDHKNLLTFLNDHQIVLNQPYLLTKKDDFNDMIEISNKSGKVILSFSTAKMIFID